MTKEFLRMKLSDLVPYENNPRHNEEAVDATIASMQQCGNIDPIEVDENNVILSGHTRRLALMKMGYEESDVVRVSGLTDLQKKKYRILANKTNEFAGWDFGKLEEELDGLDFEGFDFGFDLDLDGILEDEKEIEEDEIPLKAETRCKLGDLWQLGSHRLICGDSTDVAVIDRLMDGVKADIAITSPPYGESNSAPIRQHYERGKKRINSLYENHDDDIQSWFDLINGSFQVMRGASTAQFINIQMLADNKRDLLRFLNDNKDCFVDVIVWDKKKAPPQMESNILNNGFEFIFCFYEDGASRKIPFGNFHGNTTNIIELSVGHNDYAEIHKAVYPVGLPAKIMEIASKAKSVLDVFGGTGTTLIACEQLNRKCYMAEISPEYCDVILQRWENLTGKKATRIKSTREE